MAFDYPGQTAWASAGSDSPYPIIGSGAGGGPSSYTGGDFFSQNPMLLPMAGGAAAMGYSAFKGSQDLPFQGQMQGAIGGLGEVAQRAGAGYDELMGRGRTLTDPIMSGKLPPGAEQSVLNMVKGQETSTKGRYASLGLTGSTMEGDALQNVQNQATAQRFQIAQQMAQLGAQAVTQAIQELGLEERAYGDQTTAYGNMMKAQMEADKSTAATIGAFAGAMGKAVAFM